MEYLKKIITYIYKPYKILLYLVSRNMIYMEDTAFLKLKYKNIIGEKLNLNNPQTFNEKLQWLKLNDRKDIYTTMVDKYEVKKYVSDVIGEKYIIPTLGIYNSFDEIDFEKLPNKFVVKCTHDSGSTIICKDKKKFDIKKAKKKINKALKYNYYYAGREWPYKNVKPRIIIEEYIEDYELKDLRDYKFFCFNGKVNLFKVDFNRFLEHRANYYDKNLKLLEFGEEVCPPDFEKKIEIPKDIMKMILLAEKLANGTKFVRIDFYYTNKKIYFGEMTFYPASGFGKFIPDSWDERLGEMINL